MIASALALFGFVVVRFRARLLSGLAYRWLRGRGGAWMAREKVLIIGGGAAGQFMAWFLNNGDQINAFHVVGIVDDDLYKQGTRMQGVPVLGRREDIPRLVEKQDIGILVFAIHNIKSADRQALLEICANTSAQVVMMPDLLAMMNAVSQGSPSNGNGEVDDQMEGSLSQSTEFTGLKIQPDQLRESLEEIDAFLAEGDLAAARDRLCALEKQLQIPVRQNQSPVEAMTSASEGK
ncbi:MAG: hypothetical protein M1281_18675 [Chloroflexi bacterium]|nr:hypothetical protein [Chloroflexota bacterium]